MKSKQFLINCINFYQKYITPFTQGTKKSCVFYPSCSEYAKEAILKYGAMKGIYLGILRIFRCHPWQKNTIDPLK